MAKVKTRSVSWKRNLLIGILVGLAALFLVFHIYLSSWLLDYVNGVLAKVPGYSGSVQGITLDLYRGAYKIHKLTLNKKEGTIPTPFIAIEEADLSVQWSGLLHGRIVSDIELTQPVINFAVNHDAKQTGDNVDWTKPIKDLMPIDINRVAFQDGAITYQDFSAHPQVNVFIHHMNGSVTNLRNVEAHSEGLPSTVDVTGSSIGNGDLKIHGKLNILKEVPDMDLLLSLENVDLPALNNYSEAYAAFDFKTGDFAVYMQLKVKDDQVSGYVKPIVRQLAVDVFKNGNPLEVAWSSAVAGVLKIFTNPSKDQFATKVDLEGQLSKINTNVWSALTGVVSNAFINAMSKGFDDSGDPGLLKPVGGDKAPASDAGTDK